MELKKHRKLHLSMSFLEMITIDISIRQWLEIQIQKTFLRIIDQPTRTGNGEEMQKTLTLPVFMVLRSFKMVI
jgi:hypothetical protein